jgi:methylmalonyl-CoA mutase
LTPARVRVTSITMTHEQIHPNFPLAQGFPSPDFADWEALAQKALKGVPLDKLNATTYDGVVIKPLYTLADVPEVTSNPPTAPRDPFLPWDVRQIVVCDDVTSANATALEDLQRGVSSIEFCLGDDLPKPEEARKLLAGIHLDMATVAFDTPADPLGSAQIISDAIDPAARATAKLAFNLDPFGQILLGGGALSVSDAVACAQTLGKLLPAATFLRADARPVHEGGGSEAQELAVLIAAGIGYLREGERTGMTPEQANSTCLFTISVGPDVVLEIAKLKAARRLWARVMEASGAPHAVMGLQAVTSARMQSIADPWTNVLRSTCAAFAAGAGGADIITVLPFNSAYAPADAQSRRIARNTQLILQEETHLGRVKDPAAGAYAMEALAEDLAQAAWALVQEIERAGGLGAALQSGLVQGWVAQTRTARERDIARRKTALVGVSVYPNLGERLNAFPPPSNGGGARRAEGVFAPDGAIVETNTPSVSFADSSPVGRGSITTIPPMRLSAPFEALRAKPEQTIFLATLGPIAKFNARSGFAKNAFEAGGIRAIGAEDMHEGDQAIIAAFTKSGAKIACLCGDDDTYQSRAAPLAQALKHAGAKAVWLAGKGSYQSVDRTIFAGNDILAELTFAHDILEGAQ